MNADRLANAQQITIDQATDLLTIEKAGDERKVALADGSTIAAKMDDEGRLVVSSQGPSGSPLDLSLVTISQREIGDDVIAEGPRKCYFMYTDEGGNFVVVYYKCGTPIIIAS